MQVATDRIVLLFRHAYHVDLEYLLHDGVPGKCILPPQPRVSAVLISSSTCSPLLQLRFNCESPLKHPASRVPTDMSQTFTSHPQHPLLAGVVQSSEGGLAYLAPHSQHRVERDVQHHGVRLGRGRSGPGSPRSAVFP